MSFRIEEPRILSATDMFIWWCKQKIRNKRYLKIKYETSHANQTILVSRNKDELQWLIQHIFILEEKILKYEEQERGKVYYTKKIEEIYHMKREVHEANDRIRHLKNVNLDTEHIIMSEKTFRNIIVTYNIKAKDRMINHGEVINMKQYLGYLYVQKMPRNHPKFEYNKGDKTPNWMESNKYKQELIDKGIEVKDADHPDGKDWIVYYTDPFYVRVSWTKKKGACRVKNHTYYRFSTSSGQKGFKKQLSNANMNNPILYRKYIKNKVYYANLPNRQSA